MGLYWVKGKSNSSNTAKQSSCYDHSCQPYMYTSDSSLQYTFYLPYMWDSVRKVKETVTCLKADSFCHHSFERG